MIQTLGELCQRVGEELLKARSRQDFSASQVDRNGGPSYKTVRAIEKGEIGTIQNLDRHVTALGLNTVDLFRSLLAPDDQQLTPDAAKILRAYEVGGPDERAALVAVAAAILRKLPPPASGQSPAGPQGIAPRKS